MVLTWQAGQASELDSRRIASGARPGSAFRPDGAGMLGPVTASAA
ncbi:hypothetical protein [Paracoccus hibiscisoli]|nr:hypothetical protein [Paracoccus hibiscisoli]